MREQNFYRCQYDYCFYFIVEDGEQIFLLLFVNDMLICRIDKNKISRVKMKLANRFKMKTVGTVDSYVGINIKYKYGDKHLFTLSQKHYTEKNT